MASDTRFPSWLRRRGYGARTKHRLLRSLAGKRIDAVIEDAATFASLIGGNVLPFPRTACRIAWAVPVDQPRTGNAAAVLSLGSLPHTASSHHDHTA